MSGCLLWIVAQLQRQRHPTPHLVGPDESSILLWSQASQGTAESANLTGRERHCQPQRYVHSRFGAWKLQTLTPVPMRWSHLAGLVWLMASTVSATSYSPVHGEEGSSASDDVVASVRPNAAATNPDPELHSSESPVADRPSAFEYVEIPQATANSNTFRKVSSPVCPDSVSNKLVDVYKKNRSIFDACAVESHYQIFPYSGTRITDLQLRAMVTSEACRAIATACVVANVPECDISGLPLKAVTETLLKLMVDVETGAMAVKEIDRSLFFSLYQWRRDVNLAQSAKVPCGNDSLLYKDFSRGLQTALAHSAVHVSSDLTIAVDDITDNDGDRPTGDILDSSQPLFPSSGSGEEPDTSATSASSSPTPSSRVPSKTALPKSSVRIHRLSAAAPLVSLLAALWLCIS